jgi:hypothetical protein
VPALSVLILAAIASVTSAAAQSGQAASSAPLEASIDQAEQRYRAGERQEARRLFSEVIQRIETLPDPGTATPLLARALYYRARTSADAGESAAAERDVERLLTLVPETIVDPSLVSRSFADLFQAVRRRTVTDLEIAVDPADAVVRIDERPVDRAASGTAVRSGPHVITATRDGFAAVRREVDVPAGGRVRLELRLEPLEAGAARDGTPLPAPQRWTVFHLHAATYCGGRLLIENGTLTFRSVTEGAHTFAAPLADVREVGGNRMLAGGLKYGGSFHVRLATGANYNFVSDGFPAEQLVALLQAAVEQARTHKRRE